MATTHASRGSRPFGSQLQDKNALAGAVRTSQLAAKSGGEETAQRRSPTLQSRSCSRAAAVAECPPTATLPKRSRGSMATLLAASKRVKIDGETSSDRTGGCVAPSLRLKKAKDRTLAPSLLSEAVAKHPSDQDLLCSIADPRNASDRHSPLPPRPREGSNGVRDDGTNVNHVDATGVDDKLCPQGGTGSRSEAWVPAKVPAETQCALAASGGAQAHDASSGGVQSEEFHILEGRAIAQKQVSSTHDADIKVISPAQAQTRALSPHEKAAEGRSPTAISQASSPHEKPKAAVNLPTAAAEVPSSHSADGKIVGARGSNFASHTVDASMVPPRGTVELSAPARATAAPRARNAFAVARDGALSFNGHSPLSPAELGHQAAACRDQAAVRPRSSSASLRSTFQIEDTISSRATERSNEEWVLRAAHGRGQLALCIGGQTQVQLDWCSKPMEFAGGPGCLRARNLLSMRAFNLASGHGREEAVRLVRDMEKQSFVGKVEEQRRIMDQLAALLRRTENCSELSRAEGQDLGTLGKLTYTLTHPVLRNGRWRRRRHAFWARLRGASGYLCAVPESAFRAIVCFL